MTLRAYLEKQRKFILSDENRWYTGIRLGRPPQNEDELMENFVESGAAERFRREHPIDGVPQNLSYTNPRP